MNIPFKHDVASDRVEHYYNSKPIQIQYQTGHGPAHMNGWLHASSYIPESHCQEAVIRFNGDSSEGRDAANFIAVHGMTMKIEPRYRTPTIKEIDDIVAARLSDITHIDVADRLKGISAEVVDVRCHQHTLYVRVGTLPMHEKEVAPKVKPHVSKPVGLCRYCLQILRASDEYERQFDAFSGTDMFHHYTCHAKALSKVRELNKLVRHRKVFRRAKFIKRPLDLCRNFLSWLAGVTLATACFIDRLGDGDATEAAIQMYQRTRRNRYPSARRVS